MGSLRRDHGGKKELVRHEAEDEGGEVLGTRGALQETVVTHKQGDYPVGLVCGSVLGVGTTRRSAYGASIAIRKMSEFMLCPL